jgi:transcriptional regulator with AAA-type ATPase domain
MRNEQVGFTAREVEGLLDAMRVPAAIIRDDYVIVAANKAYEANFPTRGRVVGSTCHRISHGFDVPCDQKGEACPFKTCHAFPCSVTHDHLSRGGGMRREEITVHRLRRGPEGGRLFLEIFRPLEVPTGISIPPLQAVGSSPAFLRARALIERVAGTDTPVMLLGESGTGKELAALALHDRSTRARGPFVPFDCSGVPETLFENELLGHEKGAFTGASHEKHGLVEIAAGGTLFLDEIGDVPLSLQVKLLRILESGTFRRLGGTSLQRASFRLVCATHRDLLGMVDQGKFRRDLFYRVSVFPIHLPPLRERMEDLPALAEQLLQRICPAAPCKLDPAALDVLRRHPFPGNVRELLNVLQRGCLLSEDRVIRPENLPDDVLAAATGEPWRMPSTVEADHVRPLAEIEQRYLAWAAGRFRGDRATLARQLGLSPRTLFRKLAATDPAAWAVRGGPDAAD